MLPPIVRTIEVPCSQHVAFTVFVDEMATWWPLAQFSVSALNRTTAKALRVEPRVGGEVVEVDEAGAEHVWGTITAYDPPAYLCMDFHIAEPASSASLVEVRFTAIDAKRTRVELTQTNWEAFGKNASLMHGGYGKGWDTIFMKSYLAACGRDAH